VVKGNRWIYDKGSRSKTLRDQHNQTVATVWDDHTAAIGGVVSWHKDDAAAMAYCVAMVQAAGHKVQSLAT
jgi:hypothetical protein